jgi:hypothetical protein
MPANIRECLNFYALAFKAYATLCLHGCTAGPSVITMKFNHVQIDHSRDIIYSYGVHGLIDEGTHAPEPGSFFQAEHVEVVLKHVGRGNVLHRGRCLIYSIARLYASAYSAKLRVCIVKGD